VVVQPAKISVRKKSALILGDERRWPAECLKPLAQFLVSRRKKHVEARPAEAQKATTACLGILPTASADIHWSWRPLAGSGVSVFLDSSPA
jgi:hypothetical protein